MTITEIGKKRGKHRYIRSWSGYTIKYLNLNYSLQHVGQITM